jgi:DNA (cytosine-5)-methyltransferase 1
MTAPGLAGRAADALREASECRWLELGGVLAARPLMLDLYCCQGGAATGYHRAGFDILGVDIKPQPFYPFPFVQADALEFLASADLSRFAAIHASPPCQFFTQMRASWRAQGVNDGYADLLTPTLARLRPLTVPWVVENVVGAKAAMRPTLVLHGGMFGMGIHRPRVFESNILILAPAAPLTRSPVGVYDRGPRTVTHYRTRLNGNGKGRSEMRIARTLDEARELMGMPWADWHGCKEAIPPAYTEHIGRVILEAL